MKSAALQLAHGFEVPVIDYAAQGNAILGMRGSGKSYTATWLAERLLDAGIPFVAFDPIGIWKNLRYGRPGQKGYPVVVAGGENGDLELTPESAPEIVRAAMVSNIPLVIDLYSMSLSKSDWKRIVESCVRLLLYENKNHGLRHVFIEEAAEFIPQRVAPDQGRVYAEIEKLARMGGNASLGYTLINQRAEEVNKAVLELCDCLFLHRQKGRHSLTALGKWLDVGEASSAKAVMKSLPTLPAGDCWVWPQASQDPQRVHISEKRTVHPDRKNPLIAQKVVVADVSAFVTTMRSQLAAAAAAAEKKTGKEILAVAANPRKETSVHTNGHTVFADPRVHDLEVQLTALRLELHAEKERNLKLVKTIENLRKTLKPQYDALAALFGDQEVVPAGASLTSWEPWLQKLQGGTRRMLEALIEHGPLTRQQLAFHAKLAAGSGTFGTYLGKLSSLGLISKQGDLVSLNTEL